MQNIKESFLNFLFELPMWVIFILSLTFFGIFSVFFIMAGLVVGIPIILYELIVKDS